MTDVVFLLLIFFIVTMSTFAKTTFIDTSLPKEGTDSDSQVLKSVHIAILPTGDNDKENGKFTLNGIPHSRDQLREAFERFAAISRDAEFAIRCDPESLHGDLVYVLSLAHENGFHKISMMKCK